MKKIFFTLLVGSLILMSFMSINAETSSVTADIALDEEVQASDLGVSDSSLLPGHPFYFFKNWGRNIRSALTFDPIKKAELEEEFASEKLIELKKMIKLNMSDDRLKEAIEDYQEKIQRTEELTAKIKEKADENEEVKDFSEKIVQHYTLHNRILEKLKLQVPEGVFDKIEEARNDHLDRFQKTLSNLEDVTDIPDTLTSSLNKMSGSSFKDIKDIEILSQLKKKLPEQLREKMEEKIEEKTENFKAKLEELVPEEQEKFQEYVKSISGDKEIHLNIIDSIKGRVLSDNLGKIIDIAREEGLQNIKKIRGMNLDSSKLQEEFLNNEKFLEEVKTLILEKDLDKSTMPGVFSLIENAELDLDKAKKYLEAGNYSEAFGEIKSSLSLSQNSENLIKKIAGFQVGTTDTDDETIIKCDDSVSFPVCGVNEKTYRNICEAQKENVGISYRGYCSEEEDKCATIDQQVNRNPLFGPTNQECCEGLKEFRVSKSYSLCKTNDSEFGCIKDEDCPLSRCADKTSECIDNKCIMPYCADEISCVQVITPAKSSDGTCKEFPTPCDVPVGWVKVNACESTAIQLKDSAIQEQIKLKVQMREELLKSQEAGDNTTNYQAN